MPQGPALTWDALVLGGGGVAGIAWETGVLLGLTEGEPALGDRLVADSTRHVGTSAGATVAAQVRSGAPLQKLFDAQVAGTVREIPVSVDLAALTAMMTGALTGATWPVEGRRRLGALARGADTPSPAVRRAVIESRPPPRPGRDGRCRSRRSTRTPGS